MPTSGEISPKEQELENIALQLGEISPKQQQKRLPEILLPNIGEIPQQKTHQSTTDESMAAGEGVIINLNGEDGQWELPQVDTTAHYLDNNFSDVM